MVWAHARSACAHTIPVIPGAAEPRQRPARALSLGHFKRISGSQHLLSQPFARRSREGICIIVWAGASRLPTQ